MKYRVTTRGWIVFSMISILAVTLLLLLIISSFSDEMDAGNRDNNSDITTSDTKDVLIENGKDVGQSTNDSIEDKTEVSKSMDDDIDLETDTTVVETSDEVLEDNSNEENDTIENTKNNDLTEQIIDMDRTTNIFFDKNVFELTNISLDAIEEWLTIMNDNEEIRIVVEGHINGYPYYNDGKFGLALSLSRARVISDYFINQGISKDRILIVNKGSKVQVDDSKDIDKHFLNRRAVIFINKKP